MQYREVYIEASVKMALSLLQVRCVSCIQKIFVHQAIIASTRAIPCSQWTTRNIMHTSIIFNSSLNIPHIQLYDFEQHLKNNTYIIDVREPKELQETGQIPNSVNIPLGEVEQAFQLPPNEFERKYKVSKPNQSHTVVLSCRSGKRSLVACEKLTKLGYDKVINFSEGWLGWEEKLKKQETQ